MARSRMSRAESPPVLAINRCTSGQGGPTGSPSCWNRRGPSIPAAMLATHHPRVAACRKKARRALALLDTEIRPQPRFPLLARKRIHIFQGNIVERMILLAQPAQELLHMPALSADGDGRQAALVALVSSKVGKPVCKRYEPGWGRFQTSPEVKPVGRRLEAPPPRPLEALH